MTSKQQEALNKVIEAIDCINAELSKFDKEFSYNKETLESFRNELEKIFAEIQSGILPPRNQRKRGMGRVIVDSWPINSPLGCKIISAEHSYLAL